MNQKRGKFIDLEGMDRIGKGTLLQTLVEYEAKQGKRAFNLDEHQKLHDKNPDVSELKDFDIVITSEPTYNLIGKVIREEMIRKKSGRFYSAVEVAHAYALDRDVLLKTAVLPYLEAGKTIFQSRSVATSLVYQPVQAEKDGEVLTVEEILNIPGNQFELAHSPDLLLLLTHNDIEEAFARSSEREKKDDSKFEEVEFQKLLKVRYESDWLRRIFISHGTVVRYVDTTKDIETTKEKVLDAYKTFMYRDKIFF